MIGWNTQETVKLCKPQTFSQRRTKAAEKTREEGLGEQKDRVVSYETSITLSLSIVPPDAVL